MFLDIFSLNKKTYWSQVLIFKLTHFNIRFVFMLKYFICAYTLFEQDRILKKTKMRSLS